MPKPRIVEPETCDDIPMVDVLYKVREIREDRDKKIAALNNFKKINEQSKPVYATMIIAMSSVFRSTPLPSKAEEIIIAQNELDAWIEIEKDNVEQEFLNKAQQLGN